MTKRADDLVRELTEVIGLEPVDAHRSVFTALALAEHWTKARVGRYLGISRARVGQKVDKLLHYATSRSDVPVLSELMVRIANTQPPPRRDSDNIVAYKSDDWRDLAFACELIGRVESPVGAGDTGV